MGEGEFELQSPPAEQKKGSLIEELAYENEGADKMNPVPWLRIDYDPDAKRRGVLHHDCHLQFSGLPVARLPVNGVPGPRQFIEFILAMAYPDQYATHRLDDAWLFRDPQRLQALLQCCHPVDTAHIAPCLMHIQVPGAIPSR